MSFLKRMRISTKIFCTLSVFVVLCLGLTAFSAYEVNDLAAGTQRLVNEDAAALHLVGSAQEHMTRMHQLAFQMNDDVSQIAPLQARFQDEYDALNSDMAALQLAMADDVSAADAALYKRAAEGIDQYYNAITQYRHFLADKNMQAAENIILSVGVSAFNKADGAFDQLVDSRVQSLAVAATRARTESTDALWLMILTALFGLSLALSIALIITRREIIAPLVGMTDAMKRLASGDMDVIAEGEGRGDEIGDLARAFGIFRQAAIDKQLAEADAARERANAEVERRQHETARAQIAKEQAEVVSAVGTGLSRLASGDLSFRLKTPFPEAYEKLRDDFNGAVAQLLDAMLQIRTAALGIRSGADEISQAADDLSRRTEQQAASLEETAGAMDQITTSVRRTADGSASANAVVIAANADAVRSGQVVRDAVAAMSDIEHSARQISQIIGVIDEIAFQTNLLALNAGVEAARAGDAGRGFAVVASEVRALAQKSASAAKEIKALIAKSADQVNGGVQLVGQTGQALERILSNIGDINKLVGEIAASAKEQASGLHEINSAVDQMDHVTQQNASMVEESTAASFALATESQQLADLIGRFNIGEVQQVQSPIRRLAARLTSKERNAKPARRMRGGGGGAAAHKLDADEAESWEEF